MEDKKWEEAERGFEGFERRKKRRIALGFFFGVCVLRWFLGCGSVRLVMVVMVGTDGWWYWYLFALLSLVFVGFVFGGVGGKGGVGKGFVGFSFWLLLLLLWLRLLEEEDMGFGVLDWIDIMG